MIKYFYYQTIVGQIIIGYSENGVVFVELPNSSINLDTNYECIENDEIKNYLDEYFSGMQMNPRKLKLDIKVTEFQKKVYDILLDSKSGSIFTYGDIAKLIKCGSPRAVGQALRKNPVPIIIPCHRVVGSGWDGGFAGDTSGWKMDFKKFLLQHEAK